MTDNERHDIQQVVCECDVGVEDELSKWCHGDNGVVLLGRHA